MLPMLVLLLLLLVGGASGAGMNTHTMVGHRASKYFAKIRASPNASRYNAAVRAQPQSLAAGSDFPDFGYACGGDHDAGEAAHWPPFHAAAVQYIRALPDFRDEEWSPETQKLVAFLFGTSVHYISDEMWEGLTDQLGRGQGMVRTISSFNLGHDGRSDDDETPANMAADFGVSWLLDESEILPWAREYPVDAIVQIYKLTPQLHPKFPGANYSHVTAASMEECVLLFDLGLWAEKVFGQFLFYPYLGSSSTPMMAERMLDLPIGGIDDMSIWTGWVWERIARWLDDGADPHPGPRRRQQTAHEMAEPVGRSDDADDDVDDADADGQQQRRQRQRRQRRRQQQQQQPQPQQQQQPGRSEEGWSRQFVRTARDSSALLDRGPRMAAILSAQPHPLFRAAGTQGNLVFEGSEAARPLVLATLALFCEAVGVGAPPQLVSSLLGSQPAQRTPDGVERPPPPPPAPPPPPPPMAEATAPPPRRYEARSPLAYQGSALAVGDFDADGEQDLVVGSPGAGSPGAPQLGQVEVHWSAALGGGGGGSGSTVSRSCACIGSPCLRDCVRGASIGAARAAGALAVWALAGGARLEPRRRGRPGGRSPLGFVRGLGA
jgi:hypothetical protein